MSIVLQRIKMINVSLTLS